MKLSHLSLAQKVGIGIFFLTLCIYVYSACRHNPGYADSDEMITIGYLLGAAHPSGYPLQIWLTKFFTMLPIPGSIAFRANSMNSVLHAFAVVYIYFAGIILIRLISGKQESSVEHNEQKLRVIVSAIGSLLLGLSGLFWMYAGVAEVGALNDFFAALTVYISLSWFLKVSTNKQTSKTEYILYICTWGLAGLGMTHVHTYILMYPGLGIMLLYGLIKYGRFKMYGWVKLLVPLILFALCFILPNLTLFYLNGRQANVSWSFEQSLQGWYGHLRRKVYSGYIPEKDLHVSSYIAKVDFGHYIKGFPYYWEFMVEHFSFLGVLFGLFGMCWIWLKRKDVALIVSAFVFTSGLFIAIYMGVPDRVSASLEYRSLIGISHRQYLIGETIWGIAIILGIWGVIDLIRKQVKKIEFKQLLTASVVLGIIAISYQYIYNAPMGIQRDNTHAWDYAQAVLNPLPQDSILMCFADFSCFSLMYAQEVEGLRTDVKLVSKNIFIKGHWLKKNSDLRGLEDTDNPYFSADIVSWNLYNNRRVFTTDSVGYYVSYIGLEGNPFFIIPNGYTFEIVKKIPKSIASFDYPVTEKLLNYKRPEKDYWFAGQKDYFSNFHTINALVYSYLGLKNDAMKTLKLAIILTPDYQTAQNIYRDLPAYQGNPNYYLGQESSPSSYYLNQAKMLIQNKQLDNAYKNLQKATFLDPKGLEARSMLAELLIGGRFYDAAKMEYKNLLRFYPENKELKKRLEEIGKLN